MDNDLSTEQDAFAFERLRSGQIKQGDLITGKALLADAIDTHPQYFEAAVRSLEALETNVTAGG